MTSFLNIHRPSSAVANVAVLLRLLLVLVVVLFPSFVSCHYPAALMRSLKQTYPDYEPNAIIDIGANAGEWSKMVRQQFYPNAKLLLLEATPKHELTLQKVCAQELGGATLAEYKIAVLSGRAGEKVEFFQTGNTGNSMFRENSRHYQNSKPVERITSTLDDEIANSVLLQKEPAIDIIKADVQGAELMVLQGATQTLEKASFVQLESGTTQYNAGGACFYEMDAFLRGHGFYLYDLADPTRNKAFGTLGLGQFDVLYVKPTSPRLPQQLRDAVRKEGGPTFCGSSSSSSLQQQRQTSSALLSSSSSLLSSIRRADGWFGGFVLGAAVCYLLMRVSEQQRRKRMGNFKQTSPLAR